MSIADVLFHKPVAQPTGARKVAPIESPVKREHAEVKAAPAERGRERMKRLNADPGFEAKRIEALKAAFARRKSGKNNE
jgi:hypothetical protein